MISYCKYPLGWSKETSNFAKILLMGWNAPQAFIGLLQGKNFDKLVIRVGNE